MSKCEVCGEPVPSRNEICPRLTGLCPHLDLGEKQAKPHDPPRLWTEAELRELIQTEVYRMRGDGRLQ